MKKLLTRVRAALGIGLVWGIGWAIVGGGIMEGILDRDGAILDMWPQTLAMLGFMAGVGFSIVLGIAASRRRFDELSLASFAVWGAVAGVMLAIVLGAPAMIIAPMALLCAASASSSLALARKAEKRALLDAEKRELLDAGS